MVTQHEDLSGLRRPIKYRPDIDGLRAIAIIAVVAYHAGLGARGGFVGVDVFFVISGYLIGLLVYKEIRGHSFSLSRFYARRVRRILPALFGVLIFCYVAALLLLSPLEMKTFAESALATIASSGNIFFWRTSGGYFSQNAELSPLLMTWTLGVEEQFYIFLPLLLLLLRKAPGRTQFFWIGGLAAVSFAASVWTTGHLPGVAFYLLPARAWELGAGVLLAMFEANRTSTGSWLPQRVMHGLSILGIVLIGIAVVIFDHATPFPGYAALLPVLGALLIIAARQGVVNQLLSARPIVFVGLVSYSWYLWHWPMLSFARIISDTGTISKLAGAGIALVSFGFAVLSYKFIEYPFRKSATPNRLLFLRYAAAAVLMMLLPIGVYATQGLPQRNRAVQEMEAGPIHHFSSDSCLVSQAALHPVLKAPCVPPSPGPAVALIGDSHAGAVAGKLRAIAQRSGYRLVELDKDDCPPLEGVTRFIPYMPGFRHKCTQFDREQLNYVLRDPNIQVVVVAGFWSKPFRHQKRGERYVADGQNGRAVSEAQSVTLFQQGLDRLVRRLQQAGKSVYLVQDNPLFNFDPLQHMRTELIRPRRALAGFLFHSKPRYPQGVAPDPTLPADEKARTVVQQVAAAHPGVHILDLHNALCTHGGCKFAENDQTLYTDSGHLDALGAQIALAGFHLPENHK